MKALVVNVGGLIVEFPKVWLILVFSSFPSLVLSEDGQSRMGGNDAAAILAVWAVWTLSRFMVLKFHISVGGFRICLFVIACKNHLYRSPHPWII